MGEVKINLDGCVVGNCVATGFVIRDEKGCHIIVGATNLGENTISVAEVLALRDALTFAKRTGFQNICVEGDSKLVIEVV